MQTMQRAFWSGIYRNQNKLISLAKSYTDMLPISSFSTSSTMKTETTTTENTLPAHVKNVLIVGGGPTAALTAYTLSEKLGTKLSITIMDKAKKIGGRMSTHRAIGEGAGAMADLGAQYLTALTPSSLEWYESLSKAGLLIPMEGAILGQRANQKSLKNFVAPNGIGSIVSYIFNKSKATILPLTEVIHLEVTNAPGKDHTCWQVTSRPAKKSAILSSSVTESTSSKDTLPLTSKDTTNVLSNEPLTKSNFDAVILTMPVPQILKLGGDLTAFFEGADILEGLQNVSYSSRYSLVLYFGPGDWVHQRI